MKFSISNFPLAMNYQLAISYVAANCQSLIANSSPIANRSSLILTERSY